MSFGQPCLITASYGPTVFPNAVDDEHISDEPAEVFNVQPGSTPSRLNYFIQTVKLYELLKQATGLEGERGSTSLDVEARIRAMLRFHGLIMQWRVELPLYLKDEWPDTDISSIPLETSNRQPSGIREPLSLRLLSRRLFCR